MTVTLRALKLLLWKNLLGINGSLELYFSLEPVCPFKKRKGRVLGIASFHYGRLCVCVTVKGAQVYRLMLSPAPPGQMVTCTLVTGLLPVQSNTCASFVWGGSHWRLGPSFSAAVMHKISSHVLKLCCTVMLQNMLSLYRWWIPRRYLTGEEISEIIFWVWRRFQR